MPGKSSGNKYSADTRIIYVGLLVALAAACYMQMLGYGFVIIDDPIYVTNNPHVQKGLSPDTIKWAFSTLKAEFWHPVTWLSLMADASLYGVSPRGFHTTNMMLHIMAGIFLFFAFASMTKQQGRSFLLAALFVVHPLHVEAVAWVAERKEVLCGFFWCAALLAYARYAKRQSAFHYIAVLILFCLGLMSKSMIVTFPFVLLLLDFWPLQRHLPGNPDGRTNAQSCKNRLVFLALEKIPFFVLSLIFIGLTVYAQQAGQGIVGSDLYSPAARFLNAVISYKTYVFKTFLPLELSIFYPFRMHPGAAEVIASIALLGTLSLAALVRIKKQPYLFVGWCWFLGTLVPVIGIVKIGNFAMADRYMYMPIVGILLAGIWLAANIFDWLRIPRHAAVLTVIAILAASGFTTWNYLDKWKNGETLFHHAAEAAAPNYFAHYALGHVYAEKGRLSSAVQHFQKAVTLEPDKLRLRTQLGRAIGAQGRFSEAIPHLQAVLEVKPDYPEANFYTAIALTGAGRTSDALPHFARALEGKADAAKKGGQEIRRLRIRIETLHSQGKYEKGLRLLGIENSRKALQAYMIRGFAAWRL